MLALQEHNAVATTLRYPRLTASGHVQMSDPFPIRSPLKPHAASKDYGYTNPSAASGFNFPCKGYQHGPFVSSASYAPGQSYALQLKGTAPHGGGSCQIPLSYDTGQTFHVIKSIEGGCPLAEHYSFTIPSDAPAGPALLAWT